MDAVRLERLLRLAYRNGNSAEALAALRGATRLARGSGLETFLRAAAMIPDPDPMLELALHALTSPPITAPAPQKPAPAPQKPAPHSPRRTWAYMRTPGFCEFCLKSVGHESALRQHVLQAHPEIRSIGVHNLDEIRSEGLQGTREALGPSGCWQIRQR